MAAVTVATRVAQEMACPLGRDVGYSVQFEDITSPSTRIKYMTDGMLLREALIDPLLSRYSVIMVDEAHERSISTDVLLGLLKKIAIRRQELRIVVSSATIQATQFQAFFQNPLLTTNGLTTSRPSAYDCCKIVNIDGAVFPVEIFHSERPLENYLTCAVQTVLSIHEKEPKGDILVFLTSREEIELAIKHINDEVDKLLASSGPILVAPMYAGLDMDQQLFSFDPAPNRTRKVILSTNLTEASVTIEGVVYVVDCGFVKLRVYDPQKGLNSLGLSSISRASASQRAGRAGRTRPGKCFRLYTESDYENMSENIAPEIQRSDLAAMILQLKALGIDNVARFEYLTPPPTLLMQHGLQMLFALGAVDIYSRLEIPMGLRMAELAIDQMMGRSLLLSSEHGCMSEMLSIAAMTSLQSSPWFDNEPKSGFKERTRQRFAAEEGDHITLLNVYEAFTKHGLHDVKWCKTNSLNHKLMSKAFSIRTQLERVLEHWGYSKANSSSHKQARAPIEQICRCLTRGFFMRAARMQLDGTFRMAADSSLLHAHPSSLLLNRKVGWVIFNDIIEHKGRTYIRDLTKIDRVWLCEYGSDYYRAW